MIQEARLVELFKQLVLINAPAMQERECTSFVRQTLENMGLDVREDDAGEKLGGNSGNLIAWKRGSLPHAPKIFLSAHLDTVEPTEGLIIGEKDGVLYSASDTILGADDKAGMAPAIEAIRSLIESGEPHGDVALLFSVGEEIGLVGARHLAIEELGLDFGYVLDTGPPVGTIVHQTATHDKFDVRIIGKAAHGGKDPELGINAIQVLADAVAHMRVGRISPNTTCNIGTVRGGTAVNVVCAEVDLRMETRSLVPEELDEQNAHVIRAFEEAAARWGAKVEIRHRRDYGSYLIDPDERVLQVAQRAARKLGLPGTLRQTLGGSDANIYNTKGVPTVVLGTGMSQIHTHDEFVAVADLTLLAQLTEAVILEAAQLSQG